MQVSMYEREQTTSKTGSNISELLTESELQDKNSKVFEQKGDLLNFKANIDPALCSMMRLNFLKIFQLFSQEASFYLGK